MNRRLWIVVGSMAAGLVLLGWLGWQFLIRPIGKETQAQAELLETKRLELKNVKGAQAQYDKFKREADATRHEVQVLRQRLDPELTESDLIRLINGLAESVNPRDLTWEYTRRVASKVQGQTNLDEVAFKLKFKGDYQTVGSMVNAYISQLRMICPEKIVLKVFPDNAEGRLTLDAVIDMKLYLESNAVKGGA
jgi:Tfp pilus assembly protein PilO